MRIPCLTLIEFPHSSDISQSIGVPQALVLQVLAVGLFKSELKLK